MAVTATAVIDSSGRQRVGRQVQVSGRLTLAGTYDVGGFAVTAALFGLGTLESLVLGPAWVTTTAIVATYDSANAKIKLFETGAVVSTPADEITAAQSVASYVMDYVARGR